MAVLETLITLKIKPHELTPLHQQLTFIKLTRVIYEFAEFDFEHSKGRRKKGRDLVLESESVLA